MLEYTMAKKVFRKHYTVYVDWELPRDISEPLEAEQLQRSFEEKLQEMPSMLHDVTDAFTEQDLELRVAVGPTWLDVDDGQELDEEE
jgi:phosphate uptake regulator